jgi:hypothetical protein
MNGDGGSHSPDFMHVAHLAPLVLGAADRAGIGVVIAGVAPPRVLHANASAVEQVGLSEAELKSGGAEQPPAASSGSS